MSRRRKSVSDKRKYLNVLRELEADGVDVEIPEELIESVRPLDISVALPPVSNAIQLPSGRLLYIVGVRLRSRQRCRIEYCDLSVPWGDDILLEHIDRGQATWSCESRVINTIDLLNDRLERGLLFPGAGDCVEGFLLASGLSAVPAKYAMDGVFPITVPFSDTYSETSSGEGTIFFEPALSRGSISGSSGKVSNIFSESSVDALSPSGDNPTHQEAGNHHVCEQDQRDTSLYL